VHYFALYSDVLRTFVEATSGQKIYLVVSGSLDQPKARIHFKDHRLAFLDYLAGVPSARYPDENDGPASNLD